MVRKVLTYDISEVVPYINWLYFYHVWGLNGKPETEKERMRNEAMEVLHSWCGEYHTHAIFALYAANSDMDDVLLFPNETRNQPVRIPMLRQQHPVDDGEPNLCLADFLRPVQSGMHDKLGVFCASVDGELADKYRGDEYASMLAQVLCDRLAEATVEKMHEQVRRQEWGYAPEEQLTIPQLLKCEYQGIRPAVGYPSLPDVSVNFTLNQLLDMGQIGIRLTEIGMMTPHASVSGFMFAHPQARYFDLGKIDEEQLRDYARRRGVPVELMRRYLQSSLLKR